MKSKLLSVAGLATMVLAGCGPKTAATTTAAPTDTGSKTTTAGDTGAATTIDYGPSADLVMSVQYKDSATMMKFVSGQGPLKTEEVYAAPDGNRYQAGDFKPVWKELQKRLNFKIDDVTKSQEIKKEFTELLGQNFVRDGKTVNVAQGNGDQIIEAGLDGKILDLSQYMDKLPNMKAFLDKNPAVREIMKDSEGHMYYAPYFDGYDDMEKYLILRTDYLTTLLDGTYDASKFDTAKTLTSSYTRNGANAVDANIAVVVNGAKGTVHKKYTAGNNVIDLMNAKANLTGADAVKILRDYIDNTFVNADGTPFYGTKRSDLFAGANAAFDADEMVALFRAVKLNPKALTGSETTDMIPFFPRSNQTDRCTDMWRMAQCFGVRGVESRNGYFFVGDDRKLHDARNTNEFVNAVSKLHEMYEEGLIAQNFEDYAALDTAKAGADARQTLWKNGRGFALYDYWQTSSAAYPAIHKDNEKFSITLTMPAVVNMGTEAAPDYQHYTESWRSVKTNGWFITAETAKDEAKLKKALFLVDYLWSEEGNQLMSYGTDGYLAHDANNNLVTIDYLGKQVPKLSDATIKELETGAAWNYTNYYRYYVGATFPVGYIKEQGMENQCVPADIANEINKTYVGISTGVITHPNHNKPADNAHGYETIVPATLPFTSAEAKDNSSYTALNTAFTTDKNSSNLVENLIMKGFTSITIGENTYDCTKANYFNTINKTLKLEAYLANSNVAYARYVAGYNK